MWAQLSLWLLALTACAFAHNNVSSLWGTYRPQLLFGMRPHVPETLVTGLVYFSPESLQRGIPVRHSASENQGMDAIKWVYHDGRNFGIQHLVDRENNYMIETSFVKTGHTEGQPGHWAARVRGTVLDPSKPAHLLTYYYVGSESARHSLQVDEHGMVHGPNLGGFSMRTESASYNHPIDGDSEMMFAGLSIDPAETWRGADVILGEHVHQHQEMMRQKAAQPSAYLRLLNTTEASATFYAMQKTFQGNFSYDVFFDSHVSPAHAKLPDSEHFTLALDAHTSTYEQEFEQRFHLASTFSPKQVAYAREITSQLIGGIGYYYGECLIDRRPTNDSGLVLHDMHGAKPHPEGPYGLLTGTPSRSSFPRGFYWDEGFHLLHISAWDPKLAQEIFESWTRLIDADGWVAREQILGNEARSQVPPEFRTQYPLHANPPTLIFGLNTLLAEYEAELAKVHEDVTDVNSFAGVDGSAQSDMERAKQMREHLLALYEPWQRHYRWFRRTQRGQIKQWGREASARNEGYRWRGRSATHVLTSGLDDYPRTATPHVGELHLDLHSWMGLFAKSMARFAAALGLEDDAFEYETHIERITANVVDLHWSSTHHMFCDASVDETDESYHECHAGYVSLFPLLTRLLPSDSSELGDVLQMLRDPAGLWSPHGIRSLSAQHPLFGKDEDYWRGAVWVPINYMVLNALRAYAQEDGPYAAQAASLYAELRKNVIDTVLGEYERTGYTWEQFDSITGHGRRNHPFTGWTSLVVLIMAETY